jgi:Protein of unknown function (DUF3017)
MANRPANAGAHSAGPQPGPAVAPPPVHHQGFPRTLRTAPRTAPARARTAAPVLAWLPYLIVLAGAVGGLLAAWLGTQHAGRGAGVVGGALLAAALARLVLPPRYAGLLASRGKALDVTAFAVLGATVLGIALSLP